MPLKKNSIFQINKSRNAVPKIAKNCSRCDACLNFTTYLVFIVAPKTYNAPFADSSGSWTSRSCTLCLLFSGFIFRSGISWPLCAHFGVRFKRQRAADSE
jgi:hypothetical protein